MERAVTVACVQAEPVILDREATLDRLETLAGEAAGNGAGLVVFPETFVPVYPSSRWAVAFAAQASIVDRRCWVCPRCGNLVIATSICVSGRSRST